MKTQLSWGTRLRLGFLALLIWLPVRLLLATVRVRVLHADRLASTRALGKPVLYAFWHGRQLALFMVNPESRLGVLISHSKDGEMHSHICRWFGLEVVRGSSSRGGWQGLMGLLRHIKHGHPVGMAVDGPKGPIYEAKPGLLALSRLSQSPILPVSAGFRKALVFKSWDRFMLPRPFTKATVAFGEPMWVPEQATAADLADWSIQLTQRLRSLTALVDEG
jgi:lysophospholipid acyltransferase (LPLAT)-like uncharacterized protein